MMELSTDQLLFISNSHRTQPNFVHHLIDTEDVIVFFKSPKFYYPFQRFTGQKAINDL